MVTLVDVINNYTPGTTGTLTAPTGELVGYTIGGNATTSDGTWAGDSDSARIYANGSTTASVTFAKPVKNLVIQMYGSDVNETYKVLIDGVEVNLNTLIANGQAVFQTTGSAHHFINSSGYMASSGIYNDGSVGYVQFLIPITTLAITGAQPGKTGFDYFEIGFSPQTDVVCFCAGTGIATPQGSTPIETLRVGDLVMTADRGPQPIRWIASREIERAELLANGRLLPVRIAKGALGMGLPHADLMVSRQHRLLVRSALAERMFGSREILVPAVKLVGLPVIEICDTASPIIYFHIALDHHQVIFAEGCPAESLLIAAGTLKGLRPEAAAELRAIFGDLDALIAAPQPVRQILAGGRRFERFRLRLAMNGRSLIEDGASTRKPKTTANLAAPAARGQWNG
ncbi:MAG: Hint domain-containing protein [Albidovulum sp.]